MECYACDNQATRQCRRCSRVYCELHGGDVCAECLRPTSALPSFNLYRGSLLVLLVGTAIALWLLVRPPGESSSPDVVLAQFTPTQVIATLQPTATATPPVTATPATRTPTTRTPGPGGTPRATATVEPRIYIVQDGDTLSSIAEATAPPGTDSFVYSVQIALENDLEEGEILDPGRRLILP